MSERAAASTGGVAVDRPHAAWWISILGGMAVLGLLAYHDGAYGWWSSTVTAALPQGGMRIVFVAACLAHVGEGLYAIGLARRSGLGASASGWFLQTFLLGYPSLVLLRRRCAGGPG